MKVNFKKSLGALIIIALLVSVFLPSLVLAVDNATSTPRLRQNQDRPAREGDQNSNTTRDGNSQICLRLENLQEKLILRFDTRANQLKERAEQKRGNLDARRMHRTDMLDKRRDMRTENLDEHFSKLNDRAQNDAQKQAVADFQSTVRTATAKRRAAVDAAMEKFRQGMDDLLAERKDQAANAATDMAQAMKTAVASAVTDCQSSEEPQAVVTSLKEDLKNIQNQFAQDRQNLDKIGDEARALAQSRNEAVKKAVEEFVATVHQATADLKKAFGENGSNDDSSNATSTDDSQDE